MGPRKPRPHGFAQTRMTPTHQVEHAPSGARAEWSTRRVEHAVEQCPKCETRLSGGWVQSTREIIDLPQVPLQASGSGTGNRSTSISLAPVPSVDGAGGLGQVKDGVALGQQRLGVNVMSLIATLREEARLPLRTIQWYLDTVHGLHLSRGAIVDAIRKVAGQAQGMVADILEQVPG